MRVLKSIGCALLLGLWVGKMGAVNDGRAEKNQLVCP